MKQRFRYWVVFLMMIILGSSLAGAADNYLISPEGPNPEKSYQILNPYYFVHYFNLYVFQAHEIGSRYDLNSKSEMILKTYFNLSTIRPTKLTIKDYNGANLIFSFTVFNDDFIKALNLRVNYFLAEQRFLTEKDDYKKAYTSFDISNGKIVPADYKFSTDKVDQLKDNLNNLADFYTFDDVAENDRLIEDNLKRYLTSAVKPMDQLGATLTLIQYYTSIQDFAKAKSTLEKASQIVNKISEPKEILQAKALYAYIEEEYQVTLKIVEKAKS